MKILRHALGMLAFLFGLVALAMTTWALVGGRHVDAVLLMLVGLSLLAASLDILRPFLGD